MRLFFWFIFLLKLYANTKLVNIIGSRNDISKWTAKQCGLMDEIKQSIFYGSHDHCKNIFYTSYENLLYVIFSKLKLNTCLCFKFELQVLFSWICWRLSYKSEINKDAGLQFVNDFIYVSSNYAEKYTLLNFVFIQM